MKKQAGIFLFVTISILLAGCNPSGEPYSAPPTYTPYPTYTPQPTYTPFRTPQPSQTPTSSYRALSWDDLNLFLARDHTNWHTYDSESYTCVNYAMDLSRNAKMQNIHAWIVGVEFENSDSGHAFVAFDTSDKGVVWIEPQSDYAYSAVKVGKPLCLQVDEYQCWEDGIVTHIIQPMECDGITSECWKIR